jgi:hypothetical protein
MMCEICSAISAAKARKLPETWSTISAALTDRMLLEI